MAEHVVIIGASVGGVRVAQALRSEGHDGPITLVGEEAQPPYDKPPLSKQFLTGEWDTPRITLLSRDRALERAIELRLGAAATGLDLAGRTVQLADATQITFDRLVIATGARARPSPWQAEAGVHVVRSLADARDLRDALARRSGPIVVIGGGFIGAEVAAAAAAGGRPVTVVDPLTAPAERVVGAEIGAVLAGVHAAHGVATRFGTGVADVRGSEGALTVTLTDGSALEAELAVVGIGALANTEWLDGSGLLLQDGVVCRADCATVGDARVYALGDCARWLHPRHAERVRVEHWTNAADQARCVAHNLVHPDDAREHAPVEYVWSDQYDWKIQLAGRPDRDELAETLGQTDGRRPRFIALYRDEAGRLGGAVAVNWARALVTARREIEAASGYDAARAVLSELKLPAAP